MTDEKGDKVLGQDGQPIGTGYFWLSYYDQSISDPEVLIFDDLVTMARNSPYDASTLHRDQHDLVGTSTTVKVLDVPTRSANMVALEIGHAWGEPAYVWSDDLGACTASRACSACGEAETETAVATSEVTKQPTDAAEGVRTHTVTFGNPAFATQKRDEPIPAIPATPVVPATEKRDTERASADGSKGELQSAASRVPRGSQAFAKGSKLPSTDDPTTTVWTMATWLAVALSSVATLAAAARQRMAGAAPGTRVS